ncbi:hypothetical protein BH10PSE7_BH10PSE7_30810 [soil metagenome]
MYRAFLISLAVTAMMSGAAPATEMQPAANKADLGLITGSIAGAADGQSDSQQYCVNIGNQAADARFAWQAKTIGDLEKEIDKRIAELDAKRAEYQAWLQARDELLAKAGGHVVEIYAKMRPEASALQIAALDDPMAAALLTKFNARTASAILNEMESGRAAQLAKAMVNATRVSSVEKKP